MTNLAIDPIGSRTFFLESKNTRISKFMDLFDKLGNQIPKKSGTSSKIDV